MKAGAPFCILVCAIFFAFQFFCGVQAQPYEPPQLTFPYDDIGFIRTPIDYEFCAGVPNPPSMTIIQVDDYVPDSHNQTCTQSSFIQHTVVSILGSLIFVFLAIITGCCCCPCIWLLRHKRGYFGGTDSTAIEGVKGLILPGETPRRDYSRKEVNVIKISVVCLFFAIMVGGGIVIVSTQLITTFIYQVRQIFIGYPDYTLDTMTSSVNTLVTIPEYTSHISELNSYHDIATSFKSATESNITDQLGALSNLVQALLYITVIITFLFLLIAFVAIIWKRSRLLTILIVLITFLVALVFIDFTVVYAANNVLNKMCNTINTCHFCIEGQFHHMTRDECFSGPCNVAWFSTMRECSTKDQNRFSNFTNFILNGSEIISNDVCSKIDYFCQHKPTEWSCLYPKSVCSSSLLQNPAIGLDLTILVNVSGILLTISQVNSSFPQVSNLTIDILKRYSQVDTIVGTVLPAVDSLNCAAPNSFLEAVPQGTYNLLQEQLCPEVFNPEYSIFEILRLCAIGLMLIGIFLPCLQISLCLGVKRILGNVSFGEETDRLINATFEGDEQQKTSFWNM
eukprot:TRINITY_DN3026_c0_g2_i1.p1 TRINITY_DN3026_c0_g2~~TRINITY_DN3026_c0_g2_i1.p1  ORF type:complete len:578 (+),score=47.97 TRINITY_DN3026_c0_g2_i1:38-1735(+)